MNDNTRLDAQVRSALAELPMPDDVQTREALGDVLRRSHAERTPSRWVPPVLVAAAVLGILVLVGTFVRQPHDDGVGPATPPQEQLVGEWQRNAVDVALPGWEGRWRMTFSPGSVFTLQGPVTADAESDGASYALSGHQVRVDVFVNAVCSELPAGVYTWSRLSDALTLTLVEDPCPARADLLAGTWQRP